MKKANSYIFRWILFVPISIIASEIIKHFMNKFRGGIFAVYSPELGETISGIISWMITAIILMVVAYKIVPAHKKITLKVFAIAWTIIYLGWIIGTYFLAEEGVLGSFWYPILLNTCFIIGIWVTYFKLFYFKGQDKIIEQVK